MNSEMAYCDIEGFHLTSRQPCWCTEQCSKMSFGNLALLLCKTCWAIFCCFCTPTWRSRHVDEKPRICYFL